MKNQQAIQAIVNAANSQETKKASIYRARKGYKIVPVPVIPGVITTVDPDKGQRILGKGFFWNETGELVLCYALEIPANQAAPLNRDFEREKGAFRRAHRCKIWNAKHTKKIMCPFTNTCSKCPFADRPEEVFPSEAKEHQELSFDKVNEDKLSVSPETFGSEENIHQNLEIQEMMKSIRSLDDPSLFKFVSLLRQGYEYDEIMEELDLDIDDIKDYYTRYINYKRKFLDNKCL